MFDLITIGDATLDTFIVLDHAHSSCDLSHAKKLLCLNYAEKTPITQSAHSVGGNASNVAVGAQKLGLNTAIATELGDDVTGTVIQHELEEAGIDLSLVRIVKKAETRYSIVLNYDSERTILSYHAKRSYRLPHLPQTEWIYYTSLGKSFEGLQSQLLKYLKSHPSVKLAMNPGSYQCNYGIKKIRKMLPYCHTLFVNKEEAQALLETKSKSIKTLVRGLHKAGVGTVSITDGVNGSYASYKKELLHMPIFPVKPIAKTGAGDAYASGFLSALHHGLSLSDAMRWGSVNSSLAIQKFGAQKGLGTRTGIQKILRKHKKIVPQAA